MMTTFTPLSAAIGGALIGLAAVLLMLLTGGSPASAGLWAVSCPAVAIVRGASPSSWG